MRRSWLISAVIIAASSVACTALLGDYEVSGTTIDVGTDSGMSDSPGACTDTQKSCNGTCVSLFDPNVGCATGVCTPCAPATNAATVCHAGACSFSCNAGFADCDGNPANGCEGKVDADVANCGKCGDPCGTANTSNPALCMASKCVFACKTGFGHCSLTNATGCETNLDMDAANCGACGHSCLGGECKAGKCQPFLLASTQQPSGLAVDKTHVYFTSPSQGQIARVQRDGKCMPVSPCPQPFSGSNAGDPLTGQTRGPTAIVSDGVNVYWTADAAGLLVKRAATLPLGIITTIGSAISTNPGYVALGGGKIWWTTGFGTVDPSPHLRSANLDGTNVTTVSNYLTPVNNTKGRGGVAADATGVFWAAETEGAAYHAGIADAVCNEGGLTAPLCKAYGSANSPYGMAVDATFVYWTEPNGGTVKKAPKAGGQSSAVATNQALPQAIAVLDGFVYWGNAGTTGATAGSIRRAPQSAAPCDGAACEHVVDVAAPDSIIAADDGLYWVDNAVAGTVSRLAK